jgi:hypothetical protein
VLFFEAATGRRQIGGVHQRDGVRLNALATEQPLQQVLIDPAQSTHPDLLPKLMQHPHPRPLPTQPAETTPGGLFRQLSHHQIERMRRSQRRQQMHAPQLGRTQSATTPTGGLALAHLVDESVGHIRRQQVQQAVGTGRRKIISHVGTLTERRFVTNPPVSAKIPLTKALTKSFGTPSLITTLSNQDEQVWTLAAVALGNIGSRAKAAIAVLEGKLKDLKPMTRVGMVDIMGKLGGNPDALVPVLTQIFQQGDWETRAYVLPTLVQNKAHAKSAIPALIDGLNDTANNTDINNRGLRADIIAVLKQIDPEAADIAAVK